MDFQQTKTGRRLLAKQLSQVIGLLQIISEKLPQQMPEKDLSAPEMEKKQEMEKKDILSDLYYGRYTPEFFVREKEDPQNREVEQAMKALLHTLSPKQRELFDAYESAENVRGDSIALKAYRAGVQLAVNVILLNM